MTKYYKLFSSLILTTLLSTACSTTNSTSLNEEFLETKISSSYQPNIKQTLKDISRKAGTPSIKKEDLIIELKKEGLEITIPQRYYPGDSFKDTSSKIVDKINNFKNITSSEKATNLYKMFMYHLEKFSSDTSDLMSSRLAIAESLKGLDQDVVKVLDTNLEISDVVRGISPEIIFRRALDVAIKK